MVTLFSFADQIALSGNVVLNDMTTHGTESQLSKHQLNMLSELPATFMMKPDFAKDWGLRKKHLHSQK
jgi:hypothetical protein